MDQPGSKITATKKGYEDREFSQTQWGLMGEDKNGWKPKAPAEADHVTEQLISARLNYAKVTGKEAPEDKTVDFLNGVIETYQNFGDASQKAPADAPGSVAAPAAALVNETDPTAPVALTAETYKAPRSKEDAAALYKQLFNVEAPAEASFTLLKETIETELGVTKSE